MNDQDASAELELLRREHRQLDRRIQELTELGSADQVELARLKKRKLWLKDRVQLVLDSTVPDIIA